MSDRWVLSPVEVAAEVAVEQRERAISRPVFFAEKQVMRYNVTREGIAPDREGMVLGTDVGVKIRQDGARCGVICHVDGKITVHMGG